MDLVPSAAARRSVPGLHQAADAPLVLASRRLGHALAGGGGAPPRVGRAVGLARVVRARRPDWRGQGHAPVVAAERGGRGAVARHRRGPPPDASRRGAGARVASDAGDGALHRDHHLRRRGHGKNDLVHAPVHRTASDLAGEGRREEGRGPVPRSQGRLLLRREADAGGVRPRGRLHGAQPRARRLRLEPPRCPVARFVESGVHDRVAPQPALRARERTVLAAGVFQPGPLDHHLQAARVSAVGHPPRHLPLLPGSGRARGGHQGVQGQAGGAVELSRRVGGHGSTGGCIASTRASSASGRGATSAGAGCARGRTGGRTSSR